MAEEELNKTTHGLDPMSSLSLETEFPVWDSQDEDTKKATLQQVKDLIAEGIVAGVSFVGTRAGYETAKLIPAGEEGYIPSKSLVIITDENRTYVTSGTGAEQTLTLIARVMSAGDGITITSDDAIKADTVTFTGTRAQWEALSTAQKAKYNKVDTTDEMECAYQDIYSTTEVKTNKVWTDGKPIYRKTVICSISSYASTAHNISNLNEITKIEAKSTSSNGETRPIPFIYFGSLDWACGVTVSNTNIVIEAGSSFSAVHTTATVTLEYTKTTD